MASIFREYNADLDVNIEEHKEEWQPIIEKNMTECEYMEHGNMELLINIHCSDPFTLYKLCISDNIFTIIVEETDAVQCGFSTQRGKRQQYWNVLKSASRKVF